jgi:hypothetical protein
MYKICNLRSLFSCVIKREPKCLRVLLWSVVIISPLYAVQGRDIGKDVSSKGLIVQGTLCPRTLVQGHIDLWHIVIAHCIMYMVLRLYFSFHSLHFYHQLRAVYIFLHTHWVKFISYPRSNIILSPVYISEYNSASSCCVSQCTNCKNRWENVYIL